MRKYVVEVESSISPWIYLYHIKGNTKTLFGKVGMWWFDKKEFISDHTMVLFFGWPTSIPCEKHEIKDILEKRLNNEL